ncbi:MAG: PAS domain-containing protein [Alphaproteobacteria bacterium]|nr:PAS domain-containing protein [Alphaproteobacteria bacterium]
MTDELLKNVIIASMVLELVLLAVIIYMQIKVYKYRRKIYFIKRDRERCNEVLFAAKDGYFCFVYPDNKIKDPQKGIKERCSRRLSVMLDLKNGTLSSFSEICDMFYKDDAKMLRKYIARLQQDGVCFQDVMALKKENKSFCVYGNRINGADNNLYCDVVWFREISEETAKISSLETEKEQVKSELRRLEDMADGFDYPLWIRDDKLKLVYINKKYAEYAGASGKSEVLEKGMELRNNKGENVAVKLAAAAQKSQRIQHKNFNMVHAGKLGNYVMYENPYFVDDSLDKIGTVGYLCDNTELENIKLNFKINQNNHLEILGALGTAFAIFDKKMKLYFYNGSFKNMWGLENEFLENTPTYPQFLEHVREHKLLAPVPDFKAYREDEISVFNGLINAKEDLLHLPDGRTVRRWRSPHPNGVIFAFEDISDRLATMRRLDELTSVQQDVLDNLSDSVVIFGANQRLKFYNRSYLRLWGLNDEKMQDEPKLEDIISMQKLFFSNVDDWKVFKDTMLSGILSGQKFTLSRDDKTELNVSPAVFYDGSIMITYTKK